MAHERVEDRYRPIGFARHRAFERSFGWLLRSCVRITNKGKLKTREPLAATGPVHLAHKYHHQTRLYMSNKNPEWRCVLRSSDGDENYGRVYWAYHWKRCRFYVLEIGSIGLANDFRHIRCLSYTTQDHTIRPISGHQNTGRMS